LVFIMLPVAFVEHVIILMDPINSYLSYQSSFSFCLVFYVYFYILFNSSELYQLKMWTAA
jgi:hypothetical protein